MGVYYFKIQWRGSCSGACALVQAERQVLEGEAQIARERAASVAEQEVAKAKLTLNKRKLKRADTGATLPPPARSGSSA